MSVIVFGEPIPAAAQRPASVLYYCGRCSAPVSYEDDDYGIGCKRCGEGADVEVLDDAIYRTEATIDELADALEHARLELTELKAARVRVLGIQVPA